MYSKPSSTKFDPEFAEWWKKGDLRKCRLRSILPTVQTILALAACNLRHVGFLGAMPPAVKGLRNPEFAENEQGVVDFSDWAEAGLWRRLREWFIGKHGQDEADKALPDYLVNSVVEESIRNDLKRYQQDETGFPVPNFNEPNNPTSDPAQSTEGELEMTPEEIEQLKAENEKLKAEKAETALNQAKAENADFAEGLVKAGKLARLPNSKQWIC